LPDHGRAVRGARADHHPGRVGGGRQAQAGGPVDPAGRAERGARAQAGRLRARDEQGQGGVLGQAGRAVGERRHQGELSGDLRVSPALSASEMRGGCSPGFATLNPGYDLTLPPSTLSVCPVMNAASSLVRKLITPTRSSGTSGRRIAWKVLATWANSSSM